MVAGYQTQSAMRGGTWKGVLLLLALTLLSVLSVTIYGYKISFLFLPLVAVFLWPRVETPVASIIFILLFGLLLDVLSSGPLGLWSIVFLSVFTIFGPYRRTTALAFFPAFRLWFLALGVALVTIYLLGWFAMRNAPDVLPLILQAIAVTVMFPCVYGARHLGRSLLSETGGGR